MSRSMTDKELVDLMVSAPRNFSVVAPDVQPFNAKPGFTLPPPSELVLSGIPASHVASEVIALVEHKRAIEAQRDELVEAFKEVLRITDRKHDAWDRAYAAIANAKGGA